MSPATPRTAGAAETDPPTDGSLEAGVALGRHSSASETGEWSRRELGILAGIVALAFVLRLPGLTESIWFDELWSTRVKLGSLDRLVRTVAVDVHPPFYLALQACILVLRGRFARMSPAVLWNVFADQLLVPWNSFHTPEELRAWGTAAGCRTVGEATITLGQQIEALFEKPR